LWLIRSTRKVEGAIGIRIGIGRDLDIKRIEKGTESLATGIEIVRKEIETGIRIGSVTEIVIETDIILADGMRIIIRRGTDISRRGGMMMNIAARGDLDAIETGTERDTRSQKETGIRGKKDSGR
jgi:hypothetical protein